MKENRVSLFTKNTADQYGGRVLVLDLNRNLNHNYNTAVAKHPIEGAGYSSSDHAYQKNIIIGVNGHISNAVKPVIGSEAESYDVFGVFRDSDTYRNVLLDQAQFVERDIQILKTIDENTPLTIEQADTLENVSGTALYSPGDLIPNFFRDLRIDQATLLLLDLEEAVFFREATNKQKQTVRNLKNLRALYSRDQESKQLDAFELLEAIYHKRLLLDVLTTTRLYENMVMTRLNLPRVSGAGTALEIAATFEQQSFHEASLSTRAIRPADVITQKNKGKNQGKNDPVFLRQLSERLSPLLERALKLFVGAKSQ